MTEATTTSDLRLAVLRENDLPAELESYLRGDTREQMEADARVLAAYVPEADLTDMNQRIRRELGRGDAIDRPANLAELNQGIRRRAGR